MTDARDILAHLEREPDSDILAYMLTDALMEERGMLRSEADRHVERVRADARIALDMAFAAKLVKAHGHALDMLRMRIVAELHLEPTDEWSLILAPNMLPPWVSAANGPIDEWHVWGVACVSVGASWVRQWWLNAGQPTIKRVGRFAR